MVLRPQAVGRGRALHDAVRILHVHVELALGRHVGGPHALALARPARAAVAGRPRRRRRRRCARRRIGAGRRRSNGSRAGRRRRRPFLAQRVVPERAHELPARAGILGAEEAAGACRTRARAARRRRPAPAPTRARSSRGSPCPTGRVPARRGLLRVGGRRALLERRGPFGRAMHLDAEVAVVERGVHAVVARVAQHHETLSPRKRVSATRQKFGEAPLRSRGTGPFASPRGCASCWSQLPSRGNQGPANG